MAGLRRADPGSPTDMNPRRRKRRRARIADKLRGHAAGRSTEALAVYTGRKTAGKRAPLKTLPVVAGASIASPFAVRHMRRGVNQSIPD